MLRHFWVNFWRIPSYATVLMNLRARLLLRIPTKDNLKKCSFSQRGLLSLPHYDVDLTSSAKKKKIKKVKMLSVFKFGRSLSGRLTDQLSLISRPRPVRLSQEDNSIPLVNLKSKSNSGQR